jgi:hypothetical protein
MPLLSDTNGTSPLTLPPGVFTSSDDDDVNKSMIVIYGPPKCGKTFLSLSASEDFALGPCELNGICSVTADRHALIGCKEFGIHVPHRLNLWKWRVPLREDEYDEDGKPTRYHAKDIQESLQTAITAIAHLAHKGLIHTVIIDTISELDRPIVQYWFDEKREMRTRTGELDTQRMYGRVAQTHAKFFQGILELDLMVIALCHAKVNTYEAKPDKQKTNQDRALTAVSSLPSEASDVTPDITGQSAKMYIRHSDHILVMSANQDMTGKKTRTVHPHGKGAWMGGTRFERSLGREENPNLRELIEKIESTTNKAKESKQ